MSKINWKVRVQKKSFWLSLVPALLLLIQVIAVPFGYDFKIEPLSSQLIAIVNAVFAVLAILGIVIDPTTAGVADSKEAMAYIEPKKDDAK